MPTRKLITKSIAKSASTYVGRTGEIFFDTATATLKLSDGATAGGVVFTGGSASWPVTNTAGASGPTKVAIGQNAGLTTQGADAVAIGTSAGNSNQYANSVALGTSAGQTTQGINAVAIGLEAGQTTQGSESIAIGYTAGKTTQGAFSVAVGLNAGQTSQGNTAVALGYNAGLTSQGASAVAIGFYAGAASQGANSIIINGTGLALNQTTASTFTVKPVRDGGMAGAMAAAGFRPAYYNPTTGEFVYSSS